MTRGQRLRDALIGASGLVLVGWIAVQMLGNPADDVAFAAPVCCGLPLPALFGLSAATLFAAAPVATAASIGLLSATSSGWRGGLLDGHRPRAVHC